MSIGDRIEYRTDLPMYTVKLGNGNLLLICTNSFSISITKEISTDGILKLFAYSLSSKSWKLIKSFITGQINTGIININCNKTGNILYSYNGEEIHYAFTLERNSIYDKYPTFRSCFTLDIGHYTSMSNEQYNSIIKNKKIYGKKSATAEKCYLCLPAILSDIDTSYLNFLCPDPFSTEWGNITSARGQSIKDSEYFRLIAYDFK